MTIYIAGPMTGLPDYNRAAFNAKAAELEAIGHRILNPASIGTLPEYGMYWPINKAMIDSADAIYMLDGWEGSPGARAELVHAVRRGVGALFESTESIYRMYNYMHHSQAIALLPGCNTCGAERRCSHAPHLGDWARINCHLWERGL